MRRRRSGPEWQRLIAEQEAGELSIDAFCAERGVTTSSFHAWRRRLRRAAGSGTGGFVELRARADGLPDGTVVSGEVLEVRFGPATLLAPLSSLPAVVAALSREMQP
jgi:transposase-like protein